jgi:hypothetical protein
MYRVSRLGLTAGPIFAALMFAGPTASADEMPGDLAGEQSAGGWTAAFSSQVQYYSWESTRAYPAGGTTADADGSQLSIPLALQLTDRATDSLTLEFMLRSGYLRSSQSSSGVTSTTSGFTDTSVGITASYSGLDGFQPFLSLNTNLPTGNEKSAGGPSNTDPDVVAVATTGEGFNGGVSAGANIPLTDTLIASVGGGYTYRGSYDTTALGNLDPGDTYTLNLGIGYQGESSTTQAQLAFTGETETERNGAPYYQSGGSVAATLGTSYSWNDAIASRANISFSHYEKNRVAPSGLPYLVDEAFNSNSNVFQIDVDTIYSGETFSIGPTVGFLHRDHNAWSSDEIQFVPAKTRWSVGLTGQYALSDTLVLSAAASRIWVDQNESPDKTALGPGSGIPEVKTDAWLATLGASWQF